MSRILNESARAEKACQTAVLKCPPPSIITSWNQYLEFFFTKVIVWLIKKARVWHTMQAPTLTKWHGKEILRGYVWLRCHQKCQWKWGRINVGSLCDTTSQLGVMDPTQSILIGKEMKQWNSDFKCKAQEILCWLFSWNTGTRVKLIVVYISP